MLLSTGKHAIDERERERERDIYIHIYIYINNREIVLRL